MLEDPLCIMDILSLYSYTMIKSRKKLTSAIPGHAMRAGDPLRALGAVIGKALKPLQSGRGLIPILIALQ